MMNHKQKQTLLCLLLCLLLPLLAACGGRDAADVAQQEEAEDGAPVTEVSMALARGETALLDEMPALKTADLSGSEDPAEIMRWAEAHPEVYVTYTVTLPDGSVLDNHSRSCDLSALSGKDLRAAVPLLASLPELKLAELGEQRDSVSWDDLAALREGCPALTLKYRFTLYEKDCDLSNTMLDLRGVPVAKADGGEELRQILPLMRDLCYLDLDNSGLSNQECDALRQEYPDVKVVWRVWFGNDYCVRTDVERILASKPSVAGHITTANDEGLYYCHDVKYLDIGHNAALTDLGFIAGMPKLEVAIIAMTGATDISPLANCPELEYLEMQSMSVSDLSPLSGLTKLRHLNIATNMALHDISPLYGLTELERLWIGCFTAVPKEQIEEMRHCAPNCTINTTVFKDPTAEQWRLDGWDYVMRYYILREQFGGYKDSAFSFSWNDDLYPEGKIRR